MNNIPLTLYLVFALTTLIALYVFYKATNRSKVVLTILAAWILIQSIISSTGFYTMTSGIPPRFLFLIMPPLAGIFVLFSTVKGRGFIDGLDMKLLTILHIIRIPVEMVLFWLFLKKTVPGIMTFEGRNPDILAGISAPVIYYFGFINRKVGRKVLLVWNFICLLLLGNIVTIAILSAPFDFQKFGFSQPNIALFYFPFVWLPCCIVPLVLISHLASIRRLMQPSPRKSMTVPLIGDGTGFTMVQGKQRIKG